VEHFDTLAADAASISNIGYTTLEITLAHHGITAFHRGAFDTATRRTSPFTPLRQFLAAAPSHEWSVPALTVGI